MNDSRTRYSFLILLILSISVCVNGQKPKVSTAADDLDEFLNLRIRENIASRVDQTDPTKQAAPPAAATNSTSLVERSSAPDLLGLGLDFLNLSDKITGNKKSATPKTLTFSAYALKSALSHQDPLDPEIYNRDALWRSVSFTLGYDVPENTNDKDPIIGIKWLAINGRDLSNEKNKPVIQGVQDQLKTAGMDFSRLRDDVRVYLFNTLRDRKALPTGVRDSDDFAGALADKVKFQQILKSLTGEEKNIVDQKILSRINAFRTLNKTTREAVQTIRTRSQLALSFTTIQRKHSRPDEYVGTLTFDKGMGNNSITINGSFMATKTPAGESSHGGQFAAAFHVPLNGLSPLAYKDPLLLSIEANGAGMTKVAPMFTAQAKLTIPLMAGVNIPISVSVANRTEFVKEKEVKGKFGFTFDLSKTLKAFRDGF